MFQVKFFLAEESLRASDVIHSNTITGLLAAVALQLYGRNKRQCLIEGNKANVQQQRLLTSTDPS